MCNPIAINDCICDTSFVVLVIKLLVENSFTSCNPKSSTFSKISFLILFEKFAATFATKYPVIIVNIKLPSEHTNIIRPFFQISAIWLPSVFTNCVISDM